MEVVTSPGKWSTRRRWCSPFVARASRWVDWNWVCVCVCVGRGWMDPGECLLPWPDPVVHSADGGKTLECHLEVLDASPFVVSFQPGPSISLTFSFCHFQMFCLQVSANKDNNTVFFFVIHVKSENSCDSRLKVEPRVWMPHWKNSALHLQTPTSQTKNRATLKQKKKTTLTAHQTS